MSSSSSASSIDAEAPRAVQWEPDNAYEEKYDDLIPQDFEGASSSIGHERVC